MSARLTKFSLVVSGLAVCGAVFADTPIVRPLTFGVNGRPKVRVLNEPAEAPPVIIRSVNRKQTEAPVPPPAPPILPETETAERTTTTRVAEELPIALRSGTPKQQPSANPFPLADVVQNRASKNDGRKEVSSTTSEDENPWATFEREVRDEEKSPDVSVSDLEAFVTQSVLEEPLATSAKPKIATASARKTMAADESTEWYAEPNQEQHANESVFDLDAEFERVMQNLDSELQQDETHLLELIDNEVDFVPPHEQKTNRFGEELRQEFASPADSPFAQTEFRPQIDQQQGPEQSSFSDTAWSAPQVETGVVTPDEITFGDIPAVLSAPEKQMASEMRPTTSMVNVDLVSRTTRSTESEYSPFESANQQDDLQQRLDALESRYNTLATEFQKQLDRQPVTVHQPAKPAININGRIQADSWSFFDTDPGIGFFENPTGARAGLDPADRFAFRRVRLQAGGDIRDIGLWTIELDFFDPSNTLLQDVYLGFKHLPLNQTFLIGNQKRPLGLDHLNSSNHNVFLERPVIIDAFNEDNRRPGMAMYGHTDDEKYHWRYGVFSLHNLQGDGADIGDSRQLSGNLRISSSPWYDASSNGRGYFHWALAGMVARPDGDATALDANQNEAFFRSRAEGLSTSRWLDTGSIQGAEWFQIGGLETIINVGAFQFVGEYQHAQVQRDSGSDLGFGGGYVYVNFVLTGEHIPYDRRTGTIGQLVPFEDFFLVSKHKGGHGRGWGAWGLGLRYSFADLSDADVLGGRSDILTLGLNWYWTEFSRLQFNLVQGSISDRQAVGGFTDGDFWMAGTRFGIFF